MDNNNFTPPMGQPVQPAPQMPVAGQPMQPIQPAQPAPQMPNVANPTAPTATSSTGTAGTPALPNSGKNNSTKTIAIIILSLTTATFLGLFIWMFISYSNTKTDVDGQIEVAVAEAKLAQAEELQTAFAEEQKNPYNTFVGPSDYGELRFEYPKTWSVYVEKDANKGGEFKAYLNPEKVEPVSTTTINALRVQIVEDSYENMVKKYQSYTKSDMTMETIKVNETDANRYTGKLPGVDLQGIVVIFKIRDKTAIIQTDSVLYEEDFNKVIESITFNA